MASPDGNAPPPSGALTEYAGHRVPVPGWPPGWSQRLLTGGVRSLLGSGPGIPALRAATVSRGARGLRFVCGIAAAFGGVCTVALLGGLAPAAVFAVWRIGGWDTPRVMRAVDDLGLLSCASLAMSCAGLAARNAAAGSAGRGSF